MLELREDLLGLNQGPYGAGTSVYWSPAISMDAAQTSFALRVYTSRQQITAGQLAALAAADEEESGSDPFAEMEDLMNPMPM